MTKPTPQPPIIQVQGLAAGYPGHLVLEDLSFDVCPGEVFGILGGSGCGKTTIMKHMIGLVPPLAGTILIAGQDITQADAKQRKEILRSIGVMYQQGALFGSMTLLENARLPLEEHTTLPARARDLVATMKLRMVGLAGFENYLPAEISGGMRKRAAIARAMALDPRIIFLDEPSAGLDPSTSAGLDRLVVRLARTLGITFVMVTHEVPSILGTNDRVIMLDKDSRSIVARGTPEQLATSEVPAVRRFFHREEAGAHDVPAHDKPAREPIVIIPRPAAQAETETETQRETETGP
ncbi:MAG: ABC transporter ATP-binding protein [Planctomycetota bacterium]|jgi:phospholipid/cholesterol/gamma-HCH transport system ATP-binding protein